MNSRSNDLTDKFDGFTIQELKEMDEILEQENNQLRNDFHDAQKKINCLMSEKQNLENENILFMEISGFHENSTDKKVGKKNQIQELQAKLVRLNEYLISHFNSKNADLNKCIDKSVQNYKFNLIVNKEESLSQKDAEINSLKSKIDQLILENNRNTKLHKQDLETYENEMEKIQSENDSLRKQMKLMQEDNNSLESELEEAMNDIDKATSQANSLATQLDLSKKEINDLQNELLEEKENSKKIGLISETFSEDKQKLLNEIDKLKNNNNSLNDQNENIKNDNEQLHKELGILKKKIVDDANINSSNLLLIDTLKKEKISLESAFNDEKKKMENTEKELSNISSRIKFLEKENSDLKNNTVKKIKELNDEIQTLNRQLENEKRQCFDLQKDNQRINKEINDQVIIIQTLQEEKKEIIKKLEISNQEIERIKNEEEEIQKKLKDDFEKYSNEKQKEVHEKIISIKKLNTDLENNQKKFEQTLDELNNKLKEKDQKINDLSLKEIEKDKKIQGIKEQNKLLEDSCEDLKNNNLLQKDKIKELSCNIQDLNHQLESTKLSLEEKEKNIETINKERNEDLKQINLLKADVKVLNQEKEDNKRQSNEQIIKLNENIRAYQMKIMSLNQQISNTESDNQKMIQEKKEGDMKIDRLQKQIQEIQIIYSNLESETNKVINQKSSEIEEYQQQLINMKAKSDSMLNIYKEIEEKNSQILELKEKINANEKEHVFKEEQNKKRIIEKEQIINQIQEENSKVLLEKKSRIEELKSLIQEKTLIEKKLRDQILQQNKENQDNMGKFEIQVQKLQEIVTKLKKIITEKEKENKDKDEINLLLIQQKEKLQMEIFELNDNIKEIIANPLKSEFIPKYYMHKAVLQFFLQRDSKRDAMVPILLKLVGCTNDEMKFAENSWKQSKNFLNVLTSIVS